MKYPRQIIPEYKGPYCEVISIPLFIASIKHHGKGFISNAEIRELFQVHIIPVIGQTHFSMKKTIDALIKEFGGERKMKKVDVTRRGIEGFSIKRMYSEKEIKKLYHSIISERKKFIADKKQMFALRKEERLNRKPKKKKITIYDKVGPCPGYPELSAREYFLKRIHEPEFETPERKEWIEKICEVMGKNN